MLTLHRVEAHETHRRSTGRRPGGRSRNSRSILVATPRGPVYAPAYRYSGPPPGSYLNGYVRPYRPNPAPFIAGALLGAVLGPLPADAAAGALDGRRP